MLPRAKPDAPPYGAIAAGTSAPAIIPAMTLPDLLLLAHLAATLVMVGIIWFVQAVHYPLFASVGDAGWSAYADAHVRRTGRVVGPPMLVEAATTALLLLRRPAAIPAGWVWLGAALLLLVWLSTAFLQVPRHRLLRGAFDPAAARALVATNWLRTAAWTARGLLALAMVARAIG